MTTAARLLPLATAGVVLGLAHVPALRGLVPGLGLFTGPLAWGLLGAGILLAALGGRPVRTPPLPDSLLFVAAALLLSGVGIRYVTSVEASGDEIDYLLMAQSLWREGDLDLRDNFRRRDFEEYVPGVRRMPGGTRRADGRSYPTHSPGLSLLLAPAYAIGGRRGAVVLLSLLAAGLALLVRSLARAAGADDDAALLAWAATLGPPVFFYAHFLYTEVPCAFLIALALRLVLGSPSPAAAVVAALALGALPWMHVKMALVPVALGAFALVRLRGRARVAFVVAAAAAALVYFAYYYSVFGQLSPFARYGSRVPVPMARMTPGRTLLGVFLDGGFGLLVYAPVFVVSLAGLLTLLRGGRDRLAFGLLGAAVLLPVLAWKNWWGFSPPARFLLPLVPVLAVAAAVRAAERPTFGIARWRWPLAALGVALALLMSAEPREMRMIHTRDGPLRVFERLAGDVSPARYLPRLTSRRGADEPPWRPPEAEVRVALVWALALAVLLGLDRASRSRPRLDRAFSGLALPLVLVLAVSVLVDTWARRGEPVGAPPGDAAAPSEDEDSGADGGMV